MDEKQKNIQEKYMEFQALAQQMQAAEKQIQKVAAQLQEVNSAKEALAEISKAGAGKEILVPVTAGIFVKAELKNTDDLIVNVGSNVAVNKSVDDTKKLLDEQILDVEQYQKELSMALEAYAARLQELQQDLEGLNK
jgi:prefoldin alpha subunit